MSKTSLGELAFETYRKEFNQIYPNSDVTITYDWKRLMPVEQLIWERTAQMIKEEVVVQSVLD